MRTKTARHQRQLRCKQHRGHQLDCATFDALLERSNGQCEMCGAGWDWDNRSGRPHIDHDHASPIWAVRGLLCHTCNGDLGNIERSDLRMTDEAVRYLSNAWYRTDGLAIYMDRAQRWIDPAAEAERHVAAVAMFNGPPPARYERLQVARAAWCRTLLAQQPALF